MEIRMNFRVFCALAACVSIAGCAGFGYAMQYNDVTPITFDWAGHPWRIFDKPEESRLMITPSIGRAIGQGIIEGLTFGAADADIPKPDYDAAVRGWLAQDRECEIVEGYEIIDPQWEYTYRCD